jgi:hypothetical protein
VRALAAVAAVAWVARGTVPARQDPGSAWAAEEWVAVVVPAAAPEAVEPVARELEALAVPAYGNREAAEQGRAAQVVVAAALELAAVEQGLAAVEAEVV